MGFFSDLNPVDVIFNPGAAVGDILRGEQEDQADQTISDAREAQELKRQQFDLLREDAGPLRDLRNQNINRLLRLQGISGEPDRSEFMQSPEFTTVRDAALRVQGSNPRQSQALADRANQLGMGEYGNFQNRIFTTAGFSSEGLNNTNRLLQSNIDSQVNLLNNAGAQAASGLISSANQRGQAASAGLGLLGSLFCDSRLKANIKRVGSYPSGLGKYTWTWTEEAKKLVGNQPAEGPMAHEVYEKMPDNIDVRDGYLIIKDARLLH